MSVMWRAFGGKVGARWGITVAQDATIDQLHRRIPTHLSEGWDLFVAEEKGGIRAMMAIVKQDDHLDQLFVHPDHKRRGIGTSLLSHAKSEMPGVCGCARRRPMHRRWRFIGGTDFTMNEMTSTRASNIPSCITGGQRHHHSRTIEGMAASGKKGSGYSV